jgi:hypothetical protein
MDMEQKATEPGICVKEKRRESALRIRVLRRRGNAPHPPLSPAKPYHRTPLAGAKTCRAKE